MTDTIADLNFDPANARTHPKRNLDLLERSLRDVGAARSIVVDEGNTILAGNATVEVAGQIGIEKVQFVDVDGDTLVAVRRHGLTQQQKTALALFDNRVAELAEWDSSVLSDLMKQDFDLDRVGFDSAELDALLATLSVETPAPLTDPDEVPSVTATRCKPGDLWAVGDHRLLCGDCRQFGDVQKLLGDNRVNVCMTSPPYASQRKYDETSGFTPVKPDDFKDWFYDVQANVAAFLADDGSFFLNIKEHCEDGQRSLYVKDLTVAHVREWAWLLVDEFCWKRHAPPGAWPNRFKNNWEPVFHFARDSGIKFRPQAVGYASDFVPPHASRVGARTDTTNGQHWNLPRSREAGLALPGNVIEAFGVESGTGHVAAFPVALPDFFIRAFSDNDDIVFDPFAGSGTTLVAAHQNNRRGFGIEISAKYCDVILTRMEAFTGQTARLVTP